MWQDFVKYLVQFVAQPDAMLSLAICVAGIFCEMSHGSRAK
jgi:hypothetical protein